MINFVTSNVLFLLVISQLDTLFLLMAFIHFTFFSRFQRRFVRNRLIEYFPPDSLHPVEIATDITMVPFDQSILITVSMLTLVLCGYFRLSVYDGMVYVHPEYLPNQLWFILRSGNLKAYDRLVLNAAGFETISYPELMKRVKRSEYQIEPERDGNLKFFEAVAMYSQRDRLMGRAQSLLKRQWPKWVYFVGYFMKIYPIAVFIHTGYRWASLGLFIGTIVYTLLLYWRYQTMDVYETSRRKLIQQMSGWMALKEMLDNPKENLKTFDMVDLGVWDYYLLYAYVFDNYSGLYEQFEKLSEDENIDDLRFIDFSQGDVVDFSLFGWIGSFKGRFKRPKKINVKK